MPLVSSSFMSLTFYYPYDMLGNVIVMMCMFPLCCLCVFVNVVVCYCVCLTGFCFCLFLFGTCCFCLVLVQCRVCIACLLSYADFKEQTIGFCLVCFGFTWFCLVLFGSVKPLTFKNPIMRSGSFVCDHLLMVTYVCNTLERR